MNNLKSPLQKKGKKKELTFIDKLEIVGWKYNENNFCYELRLGYQRFYAIEADFVMRTDIDLPELFYEIYSKLNNDAKGLYPNGYFNVHNILGFLFDNKKLTYEEAKHYV